MNMKKLIDPCVIGKLTITGTCGVNERGYKLWSWVCECGKTGVSIEAPILRPTKKAQKSCGCDQSFHVTHGKSNAPEYQIWEGMIQRCTNPNNTGYSGYGGAGIIVSRAWTGPGGFAQFVTDLGARPKGTTLERIKNNLGYSKENCRWATPAEQARNRKSNRVIEYNGEKKILTDWAKSVGITPRVLGDRLKRGLPMSDALHLPLRRNLSK